MWILHGFKFCFHFTTFHFQCVTFTRIDFLLLFHNISFPFCDFYKDLHFTFISQHFTSIGWLLQGFTLYFHFATFHFHCVTFARIYILIPFHNISLPFCDFYKDLHLICISQHFTSIVWLLQRLIFFLLFHNMSLPLWTFIRIYILLPFHSIPLPLCEFYKDIHFALISQHFTSIVWLLQGLTFYFHFLSFYFHCMIFTRIYVLLPFHNILLPLCNFYEDWPFTSVLQHFTSILWLLQGFTFYFHFTTSQFHCVTFTKIYFLLPFYNIVNGEEEKKMPLILQLSINLFSWLHIGAESCSSLLG